MIYITLTIISACYGIPGAVLEWFKSYLSERTQFVKINDLLESLKEFLKVQCLVTIYTSPFASIAREHNMNLHLYADDTQLHATFSPLSEEDMEIAICNTEKCVNMFETWMPENKLI